MFWGVCISNVTSVRDVYLSSFKLFCIFWCLLCKTLDYMKLFKNQIQVYQNTKKTTTSSTPNAKEKKRPRRLESSSHHL